MAKSQVFIAMLLQACYAANNMAIIDSTNLLDFIGFASQYNKQYQTTAEMNEHMQAFTSNKAIIEFLNNSVRDSKAKFSLNKTADLTDEEFSKLMGINMQNGHRQDKDSTVMGVKQASPQKVGDSQRVFGAAAAEDADDILERVNWADTKYLGPVKDQGQCGSCWAFAATTVQETMQAIMKDTTPVRLSEQEGVDCDVWSFGCNGGYSENYFFMSYDIGSQSDADYAYEAQDQPCRNQRGKMIESRAISAEFVEFTDGDAANIRRMKEKLSEGPMTVYVAAGNVCWRWYESGTITRDNVCFRFLPEVPQIDHAVALVGYEGDDYWIIQNSWANDWGEQGFMKIDMEKGAGLFGINWYPLSMQVDPAFPRPFQPGCDIDETANPLGPIRCSTDDQCRGERTCSSSGFCQGASNC